MKHNYLRNATTLAVASLMAAATSASAYDNVATTIAWPVGNESDANVDAAIAEAVSLTKVTVGTDLQVTSTSATYNMAAEGTVGPYITYLPSTSNAGCVDTDMIEYTVQVKKGITFTPTSFAFDAVKEGTDNAYFSWSYTVDGVESAITAYSDPKTQIRRNNDANPSAPITHEENVTAEGGQKVTLRLYISNVANNKKMSIGNIKINGVVNGEVAQREFKDFKIDFRTNPYTVLAPEAGLPEGVAVTGGTWHDAQHGYSNTVMTVAVDGPVKFSIAGCQYSNQVVVKDAAGAVLATLDTKSAGCDTSTSFDHVVAWTYNNETAQTLTLELGSYCPWIEAQACDLIPMRTVTYYDVDGKTIIGAEEVEGGSALAYKYGADDVTVGAGQKFRGWFNSTQASALKIAEGYSVQENLSLFAKATDIEVATVGSIFTYPLNSASFYIEDHECITSTGTFHDGQHGYGFGTNQNVAVQTAGNAVVVLGLCRYGNEGTIVVTDAAGNTVSEFTIPVENDGATASVTYLGEPTTLTATFTNGGYLHNVTVYNVENVPVKNEAGYYELAPGDGASLQLVLAALQEGDKIYLPNGVYDFGEKALTTISANNVSIVGESMDGTIIRNCPPKENEGIGTTATLLNTSNGLYLQDLTLQNALDYYATGAAGRAVCLQDKGANTICKNVKMLSYQDTYYSNKASKFYWEDSEIHGTVDYLCGDGDVVYNRCKFVNESRARDSKSGSDVVAAPNTTASCLWGYVFLDCTISSLCKDFTFARSWGGESKAQYLRTTITDGSLNAARFTAAGMNIAAYKFKEYKTMDAEGNIISPESKVINFTHSTGNREYETILTDEEATAYTVANIYGEWAPDATAAQVTSLDEAGENAIYLTAEGITTVLPATGTVRVANSRGGFGPAIEVNASSIQTIETATVNKDGKALINGELVITKGGVQYNAIGMKK